MRDDERSAAQAVDDPVKGWHATLALRFARDHARTVLVRREHVGPLRVQKALYPEGADLCQCIVVHPPGGIVGGDALALEIEVGAGARAQLTTPGATKWYRSAGIAARQVMRVDVGSGACLEWLPQGAIYFSDARASIDMRFTLDANATLLAWDMSCLGRSAANERFLSGCLHQRSEIARDGALIWSERVVLDGDSPLLRCAAGLKGKPVFGTFVAAGPALDDQCVTDCRGVAPEVGEAAVTLLPGVLVARYLGPTLEAAHRYFTTLWMRLRPRLAGRGAVRPRIWQT